MTACVPAPKRVVLVVDGTRRVVDTNAVTVQDLLREQQVVLGENDRAEPPLYAEVGRSATVTITRIEVRTETIHQAIPFERRLVRDEAYPEGKMRILQLGANGELEVTYAIAAEDGSETSRRETTRRVVQEPQSEILAIGTQGSLPGVPLVGTVVYLANGNAWVMRNSSADKRPLTSTGDLDGRAFSLSLDGRYLLFSRASGIEEKGLNTLWLMDTLILGESARALPVEDVLFAQLDTDAQSVMYSTGERTEGAPGWKAHNDLWMAPLATSEITTTQPVSVTPAPKQIWTASMPAPYSWWGGNLALAPDGGAVAYAFANEIGFSELGGLNEGVVAPRQPLKVFPPFPTRADWVWVPQVAWSPDSRYVVAAVHAPLESPNVATDNPVFEVWGLARDGTVRAALAKQTGMWAAPIWSPPDGRGESQIAFGIALSPSDSERSRYALYVMDRDGSNKRLIFPQGKEEGLTVIQLAWAPNAGQLIAVRERDLWLYEFGSARWSQLTANGAAALPRWGK